MTMRSQMLRRIADAVNANTGAAALQSATISTSAARNTIIARNAVRNVRARRGTVQRAPQMPSLAARSLSVGSAVINSRAFALAGKVALPLQAVSTAVAAVRGYRSGGVKDAALGAADSLSFGAASFIARRFQGGDPSARMQSARLTLARAAAVRAAVARRSTASAARQAALRKSDGQTSGYTRVVNGRSVTVAGYATPSRA